MKITKATLAAKGIDTDSCRQTPQGTIIIRREFFYATGNGADQLAVQIREAFPGTTVIRTWEHRSPLKAGTRTRIQNRQHFGVEIEDQPEPQKRECPNITQIPGFSNYCKR